MKAKKIFLATFLLLAILTIGAVSASEGADKLAAEDGEELLVDDAPADIVADDGESQEISRDDVGINIEQDYTYSTDEDNTDGRNVFNYETPKNVNGTIMISSNGKDFSKDLKDFANEDINDMGERVVYTIHPKDVSFLDDLQTNDLVSFSFLVKDTPVRIDVYKFVRESDNGFRLVDSNMDAWVKEDYIALDDPDEIVRIWISRDENYDGLFFIEANGIEYKYEPIVRENDDSWYSWVLSSFKITEPNLYNVTVRYGPNRDQSSVIAYKVLNASEFKGDYFRFVDDKENHFVSLFCPDANLGATVSMFLKHDWEDEYEDGPFMTLVIDDSMAGKWNNWTFDELGFNVDEDNVLLINITKDGEELINFERGMWYDENYHIFVPNGLTLIIRQDDFREDMDEDAVFELYIPENTLIYGGTLNIKSGDKTIYSKDFSVRDIEFNDNDRRCYELYVLFHELNLNDLDNGAILTCSFTDEEDNSKNITKSVFYEHVIKDDEDDPDEFDKFTLVNIVRRANYMRDEVLVEIADFPDEIDDEFEIFIDKWGDEHSIKFKISELTRNEKGIYTFNCTALGYDVLMDDMSDVDYTIFVRFYRNGENAEEFEGNPRVFRNPEMHQGEITKDEEWGFVIYFDDLDELRSYFQLPFTVIATNQNGIVETLNLNLNDMERFKHENEEEEEMYYITLDDLKITENGEYNISITFTTKGDESVQYKSTISLVDFIIDKRSNLEQINDAIFRILLEEEDSGTVAIYVNDTKVFNGTLEDIGYGNWNRMGGYNIPVNYLNITETGSYKVRLEVNSNKGNRVVEQDIQFKVDGNNIKFADLVYAYGEWNFLYQSHLTVPVPLDSEFVLYLNGKEAGRTKITTEEFRFELDDSFLDEFGYIKPGSYDANIKMVSGGTETDFASGSFNVLAKNGTVTVSIPSTATTTDDIYLLFSALRPDVDDIWPVALVIYFDPVAGEDGFEWDDENLIEIRGEDLEEFLDGKTHKIDLAKLPAGTHKIHVSYAYDENYEQYMGHEFFSGFFTINVLKTATKLYGNTVTATYDVSKKLVITLKDAKGRIVDGVKLKVKVGSITKTLTTNSKGQVSVDVSKLKPGKYKATVKFAGDGTFSASSSTVKVVVNKAKPKFTTTKVKVKAKAKTKQIKITLKHNKKGVKGKQITLKINGKTYKAKTNKKGVATFKVKKLGKGKFTGKLKFKGDKYYKGISGKVKVTVK